MLEEIIKTLRNSDADAWEVNDVSKKGWEFYFIKHNLDQNRFKDTEHIQVTVYKKIEDGKYLGKASMEIPLTATENEVKKDIEHLLQRAQLVKNKPYALRTPEKAEAMHEGKINVKEASEDFINLMNDIPETKSEDINSYEIFTDEITRHFINSEGIDITETYPKSMMEVVTNARDKEHEIELYRMYHGGTCDKEGIRNDLIKTMQYGKDRLSTVPTPKLGQYAVVFSGADAVSIYDYFKERLNTASIYEKFSDWEKGTAIADNITGDKVTLEALRYLENSDANHTYDEEGTPVRDEILMKDDVPCAFWGSAQYSSYLNEDNTFILTNYAVSGGTSSDEEIRSGNYLEVVEFSDFQVSAVTGDIFGEIRLGYLHEGNTVKVITGGSVSGNMHDFVKNMHMSLDTVQHNNARIPSLTRLENVTISGIVEE